MVGGGNQSMLLKMSVNFTSTSTVGRFELTATLPLRPAPQKYGATVNDQGEGGGGFWLSPGACEAGVGVCCAQATDGAKAPIMTAMTTAPIAAFIFGNPPQTRLCSFASR